MKKLPIGISTLSEINEENYLYIDKTHHVAMLTGRGKYFYLGHVDLASLYYLIP